MTFRSVALGLALLGGTAEATGAPREASAAGAVVVLSVTADSHPVPPGRDGWLTLPTGPQSVAFTFGPATNAAQRPLRIRYRLDGLDEDWREFAGEMRLGIRFLGSNGDQVGVKSFPASGQSAGWTGRLK